MKKIISLVSLLFAAVAANAQQPQAIDEIQAQYLFETGQLRTALGQAQAQIIQLRRENAELKAKGEQKPEAKK